LKILLIIHVFFSQQDGVFFTIVSLDYTRLDRRKIDFFCVFKLSFLVFVSSFFHFSILVLPFKSSFFLLFQRDFDGFQRLKVHFFASILPQTAVWLPNLSKNEVFWQILKRVFEFLDFLANPVFAILVKKSLLSRDIAPSSRPAWSWKVFFSEWTFTPTRK